MSLIEWTRFEVFECMADKDTQVKGSCGMPNRSICGNFPCWVLLVCGEGDVYVSRQMLGDKSLPF